MLSAVGETNLFYWVWRDMLMRYPYPYYFFNFIWLPTVRRVPWVIIPILWQRASAYSIMWVVKKRALFY